MRAIWPCCRTRTVINARQQTAPGAVDRFIGGIAGNPPVSAVVALGLGLIPGLNLLSGALLALVALLRGYAQALIVIAAAAAGLALLGWASGLGPVHALLAVPGGPLLGVWLPALVLAAVVRAGRSLSLAVAIGALAGCLVVVGQLTLIAHPLAFWHGVLADTLAPLKALEGQNAAQWRHNLEAMARLMPGVSSAALLLGAGAMVLLARYLQARLLRPGAFGAEFCRLRLGRAVTVLASLVLVARLVYPELILENLAVVVLAMFVFQGLAVTHAVFRLRGWPRWALTLFYVLLVLPVSSLWMAGLVSGIGLVDNWFDFRQLQARAEG